MAPVSKSLEAGLEARKEHTVDALKDIYIPNKMIISLTKVHSRDEE